MPGTPPLKNSAQSHLIRTAATACAAFIGYGCWAFWINRAHGTFPAIKAFSVQGSFAFIATLTLTLLARYFYGALGTDLKALFLTFTLCLLISLTVPASLHWLAGTPEILKSIMPGLIWGSIYLISYLGLLHRSSRAVSIR